MERRAVGRDGAVCTVTLLHRQDVALSDKEQPFHIQQVRRPAMYTHKCILD